MFTLIKHKGHAKIHQKDAKKNYRVEPRIKFISLTPYCNSLGLHFAFSFSCLYSWTYNCRRGMTRLRVAQGKFLCPFTLGCAKLPAIIQICYLRRRISTSSSEVTSVALSTHSFTFYYLKINIHKIIQ